MADHAVQGYAFYGGLVETGIVQEDEGDQDADHYAEIQADKIEGEKAFVLFQAAPGGFEIVVHGGMVLTGSD
jgi:hypothetical protein